MSGSERAEGPAFFVGVICGGVIMLIVCSIIFFDGRWRASDITRCAELPQWCQEEMPRLHAALKEAGL